MPKNKKIIDRETNHRQQVEWDHMQPIFFKTNVDLTPVELDGMTHFHNDH